MTVPPFVFPSHTPERPESAMKLFVTLMFENGFVAMRSFAVESVTV